MKYFKKYFWQKILLIPALIIATLLANSCEMPEYRNGPSSRIQSFTWLYCGEWRQLNGKLTEIDTSIANCNSTPYNIFTTQIDSQFLMQIDTLNWSRDSSFTISWNDIFSVKINAPNRPSSCGGPLLKDTSIEHSWKTKIDSFQLNNNLPDDVYITNVPNTPYKIRLEPRWIMYDEYLSFVNVTLLSATGEPLLTRELYRSFPLIRGF